MPVIGCPRMSLDLIPRLFFSTIIMPKDPAAKEGDAPKGPNVRRINPGGSSHTQFGGGEWCRVYRSQAVAGSLGGNKNQASASHLDPMF